LIDVPAMSVILVTPDHYGTIRRTMSHLHAQTARARLEVVVVAPSVESLGLPPAEAEGFWGVSVIVAGGITSAAGARVEAVKRAKAPIVAFSEDHCFPDPDWAAALIAAHREPWAAVGPAMFNANPATMTSWTNLYMGFAQWVDPASAGPVDALPGHNCSYKRQILLDYGPELHRMLESEGFMHRDLRSRGELLYLEPAAKAYHQNISRPWSSASLRYLEGREYAGLRMRSEQWSLLRRAVYLGGGPLIPVAQCRRLWREASRSTRERGLVPRILPSLALGILAWTLGEMVGYAGGIGDASRKLSDFEFHRGRHMTREEREEDMRWYRGAQSV
jgi:hypothetical protein